MTEETRAREVLAKLYEERGRPLSADAVRRDSLSTEEMWAVNCMLTFADEARLAERERCAKVADEHAEAWGLAHASPAIAIATAIRKPHP